MQFDCQQTPEQLVQQVLDFYKKELASSYGERIGAILALNLLYNVRAACEGSDVAGDVLSPAIDELTKMVEVWQEISNRLGTNKAEKTYQIGERLHFTYKNYKVEGTFIARDPINKMLLIEVSRSTTIKYTVGRRQEILETFLD